jgi:hypothetical protein
MGMSRDKYEIIESGRIACSLNDANEICDFLGTHAAQACH